ncbi:MAG: ABC transporter ATP-binding protein [Actinobacteria bacterium]|nr:ABC transporter ATP-binding protein [Actinomycetota bacterium]
MAEAHIEVAGLIHEYDGRRVVSVERFSIERGKVLTLIGPNGSGKSTFLRLVGLLEKPTSGSTLVNGVDPWRANKTLDYRRRMAAVFQEPLLFSGSVFDNIAYGLKLRRLPRDEVRRRARRAMETIGIAHLAGRPSNRLSGGEAQRTSLARALAIEPEVLLLDEPLASLDPPTRESLLGDFEQILKGCGITTIYVTHNRTEALLLGDAIAVMVDGSVDQAGTAREVFDRPKTMTVAEIVGCDNLLPGRIVESSGGLVTIKIGDGEVEALSERPVGEEVLACIRPEDITIFKDGSPPSSARNHFSGRIAKIADLGALSRVTVEACIELVAFVTKKSVDEMGLAMGSQVTATFKATGIHVIGNGRRMCDEEGYCDHSGRREKPSDETG